ncbi:MAG: flagellar motor protein MotB [Gammaproteobacteria bacterium]
MADKCPKCPPPGAPMWLATFADLMSLLMCFFVLLLSFATMDAKKFKKMADSMQNAFGVQKDIPAYDVPMGTSIIAQHFSPAPTEPTPIEEVKQTTQQRTTSLAEPDIDKPDIDALKQKLLEEKLREVQEQSEKIRESLQREIEENLVSVETDHLKIIVRINENGSFPSGSAVLKSGFEPVMKKISASVTAVPGQVHVAGHSDDIPISNQMYRSNWELSAARAVTVSEFMFKQPGIEQNRFVIEGYADTQPLVPNTSPENRAKNRRVEVVLVQDEPVLEQEPKLDAE